MYKKINRTLALVMCLCFVFGLVPGMGGVARADTVTVNLSVIGKNIEISDFPTPVRFTGELAEHNQILLNVPSQTEVKIIFDNMSVPNNGSYAIRINGDKSCNVDITLEGNNTIAGLDIYNGINVTIRGSGTLASKITDAASQMPAITISDGSTLTITDGATVTATGYEGQADVGKAPSGIGGSTLNVTGGATLELKSGGVDGSESFDSTSYENCTITGDGAVKQGIDGEYDADGDRPLDTPPTIAVADGENTVIPRNGMRTLEITNESEYTAPGYQWYKGGSKINGQTEKTLTVSEPGSYALEVEEGSRKSLSNVITLTKQGSTAPLPPDKKPDETPTLELDGVDLPYTIDKNGTVTVKPTEKQIKEILENAESNTAVFDFSAIEGIQELAFELDPKWFDSAGKSAKFGFNGYSFTVSDGMFHELYELTKGKVRFGLKTGSVSVSISQDGKEIDWYNFKEPMVVTMPYEPPMDISTHQLVMTDSEGGIIPRSWYSDGTMYARVYKTGTFDTAVKGPMGFSDTDGKWMSAAVGYMAPRGVIEGIGNELFDSEGTITRAHYVTMLMRALNVELESDEAGLPADFDAAPDWAKAHIKTAAALGLSLTDEDGSFDPDAPIVRQDMFYMSYEAMAAFGMLPDEFTDQWIEFSDWDGVKDDYSDALQSLCKLGIVNGNGDGTLNPNGTSTRAEGAQFLYNILKSDAK